MTVQTPPAGRGARLGFVLSYSLVNSLAAFLLTGLMAAQNERPAEAFAFPLMLATICLLSSVACASLFKAWLSLRQCLLAGLCWPFLAALLMSQILSPLNWRLSLLALLFTLLMFSLPALLVAWGSFRLLGASNAPDRAE